MSSIISANQSINKYYDLYRDSEVVFTKDIIRLLKIDLRQICVKCAGNQWPCLINSTSFQMVKIILGTNSGAYTQITNKDAPPISVRFCFINEDGNPLLFFVNCKAIEVQMYDSSKELAIVTLSFTQRPPDDLILKLGTLLDANNAFLNRKDERVTINEATQKLLGLEKKEMIVTIQGVPRRCILWDISFGGAKILMMGLANFLKGKDCVLRFTFIDPDETVDVSGKVMMATPLQERKDICQLGLKFDEDKIPYIYKIRLNNFLTANKKAILNQVNQINQSVEKKDPVKAKE